MALPALADSPERRANALYNEAKELIVQGRLADAVTRLTQAWSTFEHPLIMKKRAEVQEKRLEYESAIADYRLYLGRLSSRKKSERRVIIERIGALEAILRKPVTVTIVTAGARVLVSVDGQPPQRAPFDVELVAGQHQLTVADPDYQSTARTFAVAAGRPHVETLEPVRREGQVVITTDRGTIGEAGVSINGHPRIMTAAESATDRMTPRRLPTGTHSLACRRPDTPVYYTTFEVVEDRVTVVQCAFDLVDPSVAGDTWGWVTASTSIAATLAGVGLLASYGADVALAEERNQDLETNKHIIGGVLLGVGVGLGIGSYFVFTRDQGSRPTEAPAVSFVPEIAPSGDGGFVFGGIGRF